MTAPARISFKTETISKSIFSNSVFLRGLPTRITVMWLTSHFDAMHIKAKGSCCLGSSTRWALRPRIRTVREASSTSARTQLDRSLHMQRCARSIPAFSVSDKSLSGLRTSHGLRLRVSWSSEELRLLQIKFGAWNLWRLQQQAAGDNATDCRRQDAVDWVIARLKGVMIQLKAPPGSACTTQVVVYLFLLAKLGHSSTHWVVTESGRIEHQVRQYLACVGRSASDIAKGRRKI